jgi:Tfp pilus assembly protein PilN
VINLLPPEIKEQVTYSKRNVLIIRYLWLAGLLVAVNAVIFGGAIYYLTQRTAQAEKDLATKTATIAQYKSVETDAKTANDRLATLKALRSSQARFSVLLADFAKYTPQGVYINSITLTGDDKKPVRIVATATTYQQAAALRDALATSPRISAADIEDISAPATGGYQTNITIGFKPGQSR